MGAEHEPRVGDGDGGDREARRGPKPEAPGVIVVPHREGRLPILLLPPIVVVLVAAGVMVYRVRTADWRGLSRWWGGRPSLALRTEPAPVPSKPIAPRPLPESAKPRPEPKSEATTTTKADAPAPEAKSAEPPPEDEIAREAERKRAEIEARKREKSEAAERLEEQERERPRLPMFPGFAMPPGMPRLGQLAERQGQVMQLHQKIMATHMRMADVQRRIALRQIDPEQGRRLLARYRGQIESYANQLRQLAQGGAPAPPPLPGDDENNEPGPNFDGFAPLDAQLALAMKRMQEQADRQMRLMQQQMEQMLQDRGGFPPGLMPGAPAFPMPPPFASPPPGARGRAQRQGRIIINGRVFTLPGDGEVEEVR